MGITRGEIKYEILTRLQKTALTQGFYTDAKINTVVQEAQDFVATEMFLADEGWNHKIDYINVAAGQVALPIPPHWAMIAEVSYLVDDLYIPLLYSQEWGNAKLSQISGLTQFPSTYRLVDNQLYFNPAISVGGTNYLQVEYFAYPRRLAKDSDFIESSFDRSMYWFIIYHSCRMLAGQLAQTNDDWEAQENKWLTRMKDIISMRTRQVIPIQDYEG